jgi:hypothetical protein
VEACGSTYEPPGEWSVISGQPALRYSTGVVDVWVNGKPVVFDSKITSERPGRALHGPGYHH